MTEKLITNTDHYLITDTGNVISLKNKKRKILKPRLVKKNNKGKGHLRVTLWDSDKKMFRILVHRAVAIAFIPNPNNLPEVNHKDGDKHNNNKDNLEWVTPSQNQSHSYHVLGNKAIRKSDTNRKGENNPAAKLSQSTIDDIRLTAKTGNLNQKQLALKYNISRTRINRILNNKIWKQ